MTATNLGRSSRTRTAIVALALIALPAPAAWAQQASGIAGVVRDSAGLAMPGVSVEAASPALIEKVRSVVSDSTGQYRIENLRPGTYTVTFTLPGFSTVKREGVELTGLMTATVSVDLRVGVRRQEEQGERHTHRDREEHSGHRSSPRPT